MPPGAEAAAEHGHQRPVGGRAAHHPGHRRPHRVPGHDGARQRRAGERDGRAGPEPDGDPVGQPGGGVLLVDHGRDPLQAGGDHAGQRRVAADADHDRRPYPAHPAIAFPKARAV